MNSVSFKGLIVPKTNEAALKKLVNKDTKNEILRSFQKINEKAGDKDVFFKAEYRKDRDDRCPSVTAEWYDLSIEDAEGNILSSSTASLGGSPQNIEMGFHRLAHNFKEVSNNVVDTIFNLYGNK